MSECYAENQSKEYTIHTCKSTTNSPVRESDLERAYNVKYTRTHRDEEVIFKDARYLGLKTIVNERYGGTYYAHVWLVTYIKSNNEILRSPQPGMLQIRVTDWFKARMPESSYNPKEFTGRTVRITFIGTVPKNITYEGDVSMEAGIDAFL